MTAKVAEEIRQSQNEGEMLRQSLERLVQLYTDQIHFIYELLQNAEDADASKIRFEQYPDRLVVYHDGKPFTKDDLKNICNIGKSFKVEDYTKIGQFGVGFKSVFSICEKVRLYSHPRTEEQKKHYDYYAEEICDFVKPVDIEDQEFDPTYTTMFIFPYSVGLPFTGFKTIDDLNIRLSERLRNLGVSTLLFMKHLESIEYSIALPDDKAEGCFFAERKKVNESCWIVSSIGEHDEDVEDCLSYYLFSRPVEGLRRGRTIDIAFPMIEENSGHFSEAPMPYAFVFFPTETESKLSFIVNGPFSTTPDRSKIPADNRDNIDLVNQLVILYKDALRALRDEGKINLSLLNILPIDKTVFKSYRLFEPFFQATLQVFTKEQIIPTNKDEYIYAKYGIIARNKELPELISDDDLSRLLSSSGSTDVYKWLSLGIREGSRVYQYLVTQLRIKVFRPEDVFRRFNSVSILDEKSDEWFVQLYDFLSTLKGLFNPVDAEKENLLEVRMIRTDAGDLTTPYRSSGKEYVQNVFPPSDAISIPRNAVVKPAIYEQSRTFFDKVLQLQNPDEYEFFIRSLEEKSVNRVFNYDNEYWNDLDLIFKYLRNEKTREDLKGVLQKSFKIRCRQGSTYNWIFPYNKRESTYFSKTESGLFIEQYFESIRSDVWFIDEEGYGKHGVSPQDLKLLGVRDSILIGKKVYEGKYYTGHRGIQNKWESFNGFEWLLTIDSLQESLKYIEEYPDDPNSFIKSQVIYKELLNNSNRLRGSIRRDDKYYYNGQFDEVVVQVISQLNKVYPDWLKYKGSITSSNWSLSWFVNEWHGKWLYNKQHELVSHKSISKYDLATDIYGEVVCNSELYSCLGFAKGEKDEEEQARTEYNMLSDTVKEIGFKLELERRGFTLEQLERLSQVGLQNEICKEEEENEFPDHPVKNWDLFRRHIGQVFEYAAPVEYVQVLRRKRANQSRTSIRAYLSEEYRTGYEDEVVCQLCQRKVPDFEAGQIEEKPKYELDSLNLCLCPNCAASFKKWKAGSQNISRLLYEIMTVEDSLLTTRGNVSIKVDENVFWFTSMHIAEIKELLKLEDEELEDISL